MRFRDIVAAVSRVLHHFYVNFAAPFGELIFDSAYLGGKESGMLGYLTRLPVLGTLIVLLAIALVVMPFWGRRPAGDVDDNSSNDGVVSRSTYFAPADGTGGDGSSTDATKPQLEALVLEKKQLQLEIVTYRVPAEDAKLVQDFLDKGIGRPELLEIRKEGPDTLSVIASPRTQEVVEKMINLLKAAPRPKPDKQTVVGDGGASNATR